VSLKYNILISELNGMLKQQYRSELGIVFDILRVIMDCGRNGTIISAIARRANLSHYTAIEKCQKLSDFGLMDYTSDKRSRIFTITEKGIHFFNEMQQFVEIAQAVKIRY
jgi:predicted transcriptional regulator